jgi:hypothetical protein
MNVQRRTHLLFRPSPLRLRVFIRIFRSGRGGLDLAVSRGAIYDEGLDLGWEVTL